MVKLPLTLVPTEVTCDGDLLPSVLGACLYKSMQMVLVKAVVPISSPGKVPFPGGSGIKIYQA